MVIFQSSYSQQYHLTKMVETKLMSLWAMMNEIYHIDPFEHIYHRTTIYHRTIFTR